MTKEELKSKVADLLKDDRGEATAPFAEAVQKLRELAEAIEASFAQGVEGRLEAGHRVNIGQQYSFVMRVEKAVAA